MSKSEEIQVGDKLYLKGTMDIWVVDQVTDVSIQLTNTQGDQIRRYKIPAFNKDYYFSLKRDAQEE